MLKTVLLTVKLAWVTALLIASLRYWRPWERAHLGAMFLTAAVVITVLIEIVTMALAAPDDDRSRADSRSSPRAGTHIDTERTGDLSREHEPLALLRSARQISACTFRAGRFSYPRLADPLEN